MNDNASSEEENKVTAGLIQILTFIGFLLPFIIVGMAQPAFANEIKKQVLEKTKKTKELVKSGTRKILKNQNEIQKKIIESHKNLKISSISKDFNTITLEDGGQIFNALKSKEHKSIVENVLKKLKQTGTVSEVLSQNSQNLLSIDLVKLITKATDNKPTGSMPANLPIYFVNINQKPNIDIKLNPTRVRTVYKRIQKGDPNVFADNPFMWVRGGWLGGISLALGEKVGAFIIEKAKEARMTYVQRRNYVQIK